MLLAFGFGAATMHGIHAQTKSPAYLETEVEVIDQNAFREYGAKVPVTVEAAGGKFLARGGQIIAVEGEAPKRVALIAFQDVDKAKAYRDSPGMKEIAPLREKAVKLRSYILEGIAN